MENTTKSIASNYGLYLGGLLAAITVIGYAAYMDLFTQWWFNIMTTILMIVFGIISVSKSKQALNGFISFKNAFTSYFITIVLGLVISSLVSFLIFSVIDPDAAITLKEKVIETSVNMLEGFGAPAEAIAKQVEELEKTDFFSIGTILRNFAISTAFLGVIGLIVAAVMKRNEA